MTKRVRKAKSRKQGAANSKKRTVRKQGRIQQKPALKAVPKTQGAPLSTMREPQPPSQLPAKTRVRILLDKIDGETVLGDLIVAFPWTREVLRKYGLRLDVEEAGDIYMSVEAFAALRNLEPASLVHELVESSKQPPQPPQTVIPLVTAPTA